MVGLRWTAPLVVIASALVLSSGPARGDIDGDRFVSADWRVRITAPKNWQLTDKTAYPSILLRMVRRAPDGKMLLSAERLKPGTDALTYATRTAELLQRMKFRVRAPTLHSSTGAYFVDANRPGAFLRQAFLVAGGVGYSLTLATDSSRARSQHLRAFDYALRSITILRADEVPPPNADADADADKSPDGSPPPSSPPTPPP